MVLTHRYLGEFSPGAWRWLSRALVVQFVGDLYKRFMVRDASERHYVNVSRIVMIVLMLLGGLAAWQSESIAKVWIYLMTLGAGPEFNIGTPNQEKRS